MHLEFSVPTDAFWRKKKVLVTGGSGFVGRHLCARLSHYGAEVVAPRKAQYNLLNLEETLRSLKLHAPEVVIHAAAYYGGLGLTLAEPGKIYYENLVMGANIMEASRIQGVTKMVTIGSACCYPGAIETELKETELWTGPLHESVAAYGSAKKMLVMQSLAYHQQYKFNSTHVIPTNLYGPGDTFDENRSHVMGALIRKFSDAVTKKTDVTVWGTGVAIREFLHVEDCVDGILLVAERHNDPSPINLGTGFPISIRKLVDLISRTVGFTGKVIWDASRPDGQPKKILDISKMKKVLNWTPPTRLEAGIKQTVQWYQKYNVHRDEDQPHGHEKAFTALG